VWLLTLFSGSKSEQAVGDPQPSAPADRRAHERQPGDRDALLHWVGQGGYIEEQVRLQDLSPSGLGLIANRELPVGLTVWIADPNAPLLKCVVRHCHDEAGVYRIGLFRVILERRETDRTPISHHAALLWDDHLAGQKQADVELRNVSQDGFQIESEVAVPAGTAVCLIIHSCKFSCVLLYCRQHGQGFLIGLKTVDEPPCAVEDESMVPAEPD
jgi:hypothetical protein